MSSTMRTFLFDGNALEEIYGWMQHGRGLDGIMPAIEALRGLARDLEQSMDSLERALTAIGAWVGPAGESADGATRQGREWIFVSTPEVAGGAESTDGVASGFVSTRSRMPSPAEAELTDGEHSVVSAVPIIGPILDRQRADEKLDTVTNEARQRMADWQDTAQESVAAVQPLPPVPQPVVDVAPPWFQGGPDHTALAGMQPGLPATAQSPPVMNGPGPSGPTSPPAPAPGGGRPVLPAPQPSSHTPPIAPAPPAVGRQPAAGVPILPFPGLGLDRGDAAGRRRAYGPGVFDAEEIARSRGGGGPNAKGVLGGTAEDGPNRGAAAKGLATQPAEEPARGRGVPSRGTTGQGSIMQPAVGGVRREDDAEHSDKYAAKSDEYFAGDPHRVAPPVIGG